MLALLLPAAASAARLPAVGWDTCDELEGSEIVKAGASSVETSLVRSGRCALRVTVTSGNNGGHRVTNTATNELYSSVYTRVVALPTQARAEVGHWNTAGTKYLCRAERESDGSLTLRFKGSEYTALTTTAPLAQTCSADRDCNGGECRSGACWHNIGVHTSLLSGTPPCASNCQVQCELTVNSVRLGSGIVQAATSDYVEPTATVVGFNGSEASTATVIYDDLRRDTTTDPGAGRLVPLGPNGVGSSNQWQDGGGGTICSTTCNNSNRWACASDLACGTSPHDGSASYLDTNSDTQATDLAMQTTTLGTGESISAVTVLSFGCEMSAGTRTYRLDITDGTDTITGASSTAADAIDCATGYALDTRTVSETAPDGSAWDRADDLDPLTLRLVKTSAGFNRVSAVLAYADIRIPDPQVRQNLQDWAKVCAGGSVAGAACASNSDCTGGGVCYADGRFAVYDLGDSVVAGTGLGTCAGDNSLTCSFSTDCITSQDYGPCNLAGRWPAVHASLLTQKATGATFIANCGINGNMSEDLVDRLPTMLTGAGLVTRRYCQLSMPTVCTCSSGTGINCASTDCVNQGTGNSDCVLSCTAMAGSYVCSGNHRRDCTSDGQCSGSTCIGGTNQDATCTVDSQCAGGGLCVAGGSCTDFPAADYVVTMIGPNDMHVTSDGNCSFGTRAPCPPIVLGTPQPARTAAVGDGYQVQRVSCNADTECQGGTAGLCTGNVQRACDSDADCTGVGTCATALKLPGQWITPCRATCSNDATRWCSASGECLNGGTCTGSKVCLPSCQRVPCASDRECGPGTITSANSRVMRTEQYGTCDLTVGRCTLCGMPGTADAGRPYRELMALRDPARVSLPFLEQIADQLATLGRRVIVLTPGLVYERATLYGWGGSKDALRKLRDLTLRTFANVVDLWPPWKDGDLMLQPRRCSTDASIVCTHREQCPGVNAACVAYYSTLRPQATLDEVHLNSLGTRVVGTTVAAYMNALTPRCSLDPTTGCGRCSVTTATACTSSDDCPVSEKCWATDSVCSGASKGVCTAERVGSRCTRSLATACSTNADCLPAGGQCRPEGLLVPGEG